MSTTQLLLTWQNYTIIVPLSSLYLLSHCCERERTLYSIVLKQSQCGRIVALIGAQRNSLQSKSYISSLDYNTINNAIGQKFSSSSGLELVLQCLNSINRTTLIFVARPYSSAKLFYKIYNAKNWKRQWEQENYYKTKVSNRKYSCFIKDSFAFIKTVV